MHSRCIGAVLGFHVALSTAFCALIAYHAARQLVAMLLSVDTGLCTVLQRECYRVLFGVVRRGSAIIGRSGFFAAGSVGRPAPPLRSGLYLVGGRGGGGGGGEGEGATHVRTHMSPCLHLLLCTPAHGNAQRHVQRYVHIRTKPPLPRHHPHHHLYHHHF